MRSVIANKDGLHTSFDNAKSEMSRQFVIEWDTALSALDAMTAEFATQKSKSSAETKRIIASSPEIKHTRIDKLVDGFCQQFPPKDFADEYTRIYSLEPSFDHYECATEMPRNIYISTLEYDVTQLQLCDFTKEFLDKYYYFMYRDNKLLIPHCAQFSSEFNYIFKFNGEGRANVVKDACEMGMRLFMMLPPGKVNFTFIDQVTLG